MTYRHDEHGRLAGRVRQLLTPEQAEQARRALTEHGLTTREAAELVGVPLRRLRERLRDQLHLRVGRGRVRRGIPKTPFPVLTPEEIAARAAEVRRSWAPERWGLHEPDLRRPGGRFVRLPR